MIQSTTKQGRSGDSSTPSPRKLMETRDVALFCGVSPRTIATLVKSGRLKCVRVGRAVRFRPEDVDAFLSAN